MSDLKCKKPKLCVQPSLPAPEPCSPAFNLCVGDRTLVWDGFCPTVERTRRTPDGTYTSVTVVDGCIVDYGYAEEATYTPPYCNPNPASCQDNGTGTSAGITISASPDNSLVHTASGLMTRTYVQGGKGVTVSGTGTVTNPYIISSGASVNVGGSTVIVGRNGIVSEASSNGVSYIGLEPTGVKTGIYDITDQFSVDEYGRIKSVEPRSEPLITAGTGLTASNQGDSVQLSHPTFDIDERMLLGAFSVTVNNSGHITSTNRSITTEAGTYHVGAYNVTLNEYGSVTNIVQRTDVMPSSGVFKTVDGKTVSYDVTGRLTGITNSNSSDNSSTSSSTSSTSSMPLRDLFKVTPAEYAIDGLRKEIYGTDTNMVMERGKVVITLPGYVSHKDQVAIHGARRWEFNMARGVVIVTPHDNTTKFTVAFRG